MAKSKLKVEYVPIAKLTPFAGNPRKNEDAVDSIIKSIEAFGYTNPILARRENGEIIAGHTRVLALEKLGATEAPVIFLDLNETDARVYSVFDNKSVENTEWDFPKLADLFTEFDELDVDLDLTGFSPEEIENIVVGPGGYEPDPQDDEVPDVPKKAITKPGDLWLLGDHRLLCGDATKGEDVERVIGAEKADCVLALTDPPYSVNYDRSQSERGGSAVAHAGYHEAEIDPTSLLMFIGHIPADVLVWTYPVDRHFFALANAHIEQGWELRRELVWVKNTFSFWPSAKYQQRHEPILVSVRKGKPLGGYIPANASTVFEHDKPHRHKDHPTAKPAVLWGDLLSYHSCSGEIVFDPFLGSGTTLIAAEKLNRRCYGLEIEPKYCDVIVERWQNFTGEKARRADG